jgi:hypothetical protein
LLFLPEREPKLLFRLINILKETVLKNDKSIICQTNT